jgi:patatin-like phospholipase/acyl hydrolase
LKIWEAARGTSAAPTFFKSISIGPDETRSELFIDAGVGCNNPVKQVLDEARAIFDPERHVSCVVSIGTGRLKVNEITKSNIFTNIIPVPTIKALVKLATEAEQASNEVEEHFKKVPDFFFRLNVEQGMQTIEMDEYKERAKIVTHTREYLKTQNERLDKVVRSLRTRPQKLEIPRLG